MYMKIKKNVYDLSSHLNKHGCAHTRRSIIQTDPQSDEQSHSQTNTTVTSTLIQPNADLHITWEVTIQTLSTNERMAWDWACAMLFRNESMHAECSDSPLLLIVHRQTYIQTHRQTDNHNSKLAYQRAINLGYPNLKYYPINLECHIFNLKGNLINLKGSSINLEGHSINLEVYRKYL